MSKQDEMSKSGLSKSHFQLVNMMRSILSLATAKL